ncbi:hypothetical protein SAMN06298216_3379 [Spirosomataceae bacterium TFI 002]|nr:hypothetical protein SAMN06298216_3379 [Spirosomataceae bacterium TFI 002]
MAKGIGAFGLKLISSLGFYIVNGFYVAICPPNKYNLGKTTHYKVFLHYFAK